MSLRACRIQQGAAARRLALQLALSARRDSVLDRGGFGEALLQFCSLESVAVYARFEYDHILSRLSRACARDMKFTLENFRPFHKEDPVEIAPLTILVGENSSGKTSFLAGFRYIVQSMSSGVEGSFNREPFFLGAYDQIAHYRGGSAGRSAQFTLGLSLTKEEAEQFGKRRIRHGGTFNIVDPKQEFTDCSVSLEFSNDQSQPILDRVVLENDYISIKLARESLPTFSVASLPSTEYVGVTPLESARFLTSLPTNLTRNSVAPFVSTVQNWIFSNLIADRSVKKKEEKKDAALAKLAIRAGLPLSIFSEQSMYASAPFRTKPERNYSPIEASSSAEGSHIPILLAQAKTFEKNKWNMVKSSLEAFGVKSGMFKKIDVKRLGNSTSDPFQLLISVSQNRSNIIDVGYGVSQIIPLIVETLINDEADFFIFQQPEVHLHPRAQAQLGFYFTQFALSKKSYLLLETHSDYIIDRIRSELVSRKLDVDKYLSVLFFERDKLNTKISRIKHDNSGNIIDAPYNYRNFFITESLRAYGLYQGS